VSTTLYDSTGAVSHYEGERFVWFIDEIMFIMSILSNIESMKSGISRSKNSAISQAVYAGAPSCRKV